MSIDVGAQLTQLFKYLMYEPMVYFIKVGISILSSNPHEVLKNGFN